MARRGVGIREIARELGCSRNTVRRYLKDPEATRYRPRPIRAAKLDAFLAITEKWDVETSVLGEVTGDGRLVITHSGETIVDVDPKTVAIDSPVYERPLERPTWQDALQADTAATLPRVSGAELGEQLRAEARSKGCRVHGAQSTPAHRHRRRRGHRQRRRRGHRQGRRRRTPGGR